MALITPPKRFVLQPEEAQKWIKNVLVFTAPALVVFFSQLALKVPVRDAALVAALALWGLLADYFKKLK